MIKDNLPHDNASRELYLNAQKSAFLELHAQIIEDNLTTASDITGLINNMVDELDGELE